MNLGSLIASASFALAMSAFSANASAIDFTTLHFNGAATALSPNDLQLLGGIDYTISSAYLNQAISSNVSFTSSFTFTMVGVPNSGYAQLGDGLTFIVQNDPVGLNAIGTGGANIGAYTLTNNIGVGFQSFINDRAFIFTNGDVYDTSIAPYGNFSLGTQNDIVDVSITYEDDIFSYSAYNRSTGQSISQSLPFDLTTLGPNVYVGFTGADWASRSYENITNWIFNEPLSVPEPASLAQLGAGLAGLSFLRRRRRRP